jgi:hypothetical protein
MARFASAFFLIAAGIAGFAPAAMAGEYIIGTIAPVPVLSQGLGNVSPTRSMPSIGASPYQAVNCGTANSGAMSFSGGVGSGNTMNISNSGGITVQTSIDSVAQNPEDESKRCRLAHA